MIQQRDGREDRAGDGLKGTLPTLPIIIAWFGVNGTAESCSVPRPRRHIWTPGLTQVRTNVTSFSTANGPWCFVMKTASHTFAQPAPLGDELQQLGLGNAASHRRIKP